MAIDGPAGAGKSTVAQAVAQRVGYRYIDTGAMYRAIALRCIEEGVGLADEAAVVRLAEESRLEFRSDADGVQRLYLNERDVSEAIRRPEVGRLSSPVSAIPAVREILVKRQREMGREGCVVMEGRDIQTVVFPDADVRVFLSASPQERARRRHQDLARQEVNQTLREVLADLMERDQRDSQRAVAPLRQAPGAVVIDTDDLSVDEVVDRVAALIPRKK